MSLDYGQGRAFEPGTVVEARADTTLRNVNFSLPRGAVLSGTLLDPFGEPTVGISIRALRYEFRAGRWQLRNTGFASDATDDRGTFRVYPLPPGTYFVQA